MLITDKKALCCQILLKMNSFRLALCKSFQKRNTHKICLISLQNITLLFQSFSMSSILVLFSVIFINSFNILKTTYAVKDLRI